MIPNCAAEGKDDKLEEGDKVKRFWEILRLFHVIDVGGNQDLPNEGVGYVEESVEA